MPPLISSANARPIYRRLRGYAIDPGLAQDRATAPISQILFKVPWEDLAPGPVGEYLEVIDHDPASGCLYQPVDLEAPYLLAQDGLAPAEGTPQFHQQMVYAVAQTTISHFERALGRPALWAPGPSPDPQEPKNDSHYVQRLRIYPHALREANAYYDPSKKALLFGYYPASADDPGHHIPGSVVFTCLSHDIIAHETAHALLDGLHRRLALATNPDMPAFHEAFADIVALLQHFTFPAVLRHQIAQARGDLRAHETILGQLAGQFGRTIGNRAPLRDAIGTLDKATGEWRPAPVDATEYERTLEPHQRGKLLVAAVFDAFLSIYDARVADLVRLYTGGTGVLPAGAVHPDLVERMSTEASQAADQVLMMVVRALDYCPPVDLTFGEYLRALITADVDLVPDDDRNYRVAFVEAFRRRGLYPRDVRTLSVENLIWRSPEIDELRPSAALTQLLTQLRDFGHQQLYTHSRQALFEQARTARRDLHTALRAHFEQDPAGAADAEFLGLTLEAGTPFEVHYLHFARRIGPDGKLLLQAIVQIHQEVPLDGVDAAQGRRSFRGGCTLIVDLGRPAIAYCIRKPVKSETRRARQRAFALQAPPAGLHATHHPGDSVESF